MSDLENSNRFAQFENTVTIMWEENKYDKH